MLCGVWRNLAPRFFILFFISRTPNRQCGFYKLKCKIELQRIIAIDGADRAAACIPIIFLFAQIVKCELRGESGASVNNSLVGAVFLVVVCIDVAGFDIP